MSNDKTVEQALYTTRLADLKYYDGGFPRLYFGHEFCQRLIPSAEDLEQALGFVSENKLAFTLVTPYVTDEGLRILEPLLRKVADRKPGSEVVFNDWGVMHFLTERYPGLEPVMGRLLNKMKRGPRFMNLADILPQSTSACFQSCSLDAPLYRRFLLSRRVRRVELDNLLPGCTLDFNQSGISGSLYVPYAYVTTTRLCLAASCDVSGKEEEVGIFSCKKECQKYTFQLTHSVMPLPLIRKGNTMFFKNENVPGDMVERNIDRIVVEPEVPL